MRVDGKNPKGILNKKEKIKIQTPSREDGLNGPDVQRGCPASQKRQQEGPEETSESKNEEKEGKAT